MDYIQEETRLGELLDQWPGLSELAFLIMTGALAVVLLFAGLIAWLKGRKLSAVLIWLVFVVAVAWFLTPITWFANLVEVDEDTVSASVGIACGVAVVWGVLVDVRLAKPSSWWAQRLYTSEKYDRAVERHGWSRIRAR